MGSVVYANCHNCRLNQVLPVGVTRQSHEQRDSRFPAICRNCSGLVTANVWKQPFVCSTCLGTDIVLYGDQTRIPERVPSKWSGPLEGMHFCPRCEQYALSFEETGIMTD